MPALPNVNCAGDTNAAVLNQWSIDRMCCKDISGGEFGLHFQGDHTAFNPKVSLTNRTCPTTSSSGNHLTCPLRIICILSPVGHLLGHGKRGEVTAIEGSHWPGHLTAIFLRNSRLLAPQQRLFRVMRGHGHNVIRQLGPLAALGPTQRVAESPAAAGCPRVFSSLESLRPAAGSEIEPLSRFALYLY